MFFDVLWGGVKAILGAILGRFFPAKTAADQKVIDLEAEQREAENAKAIREKVNSESVDALDADLDKRVRQPDA